MPAILTEKVKIICLQIVVHYVKTAIIIMNNDKDKIQDWYFTFGFGQRYENCFTVIRGTYNSARQKMADSHGEKWAFQYGKDRWFDEDGISQQEKYNLREI